MSVLRLELDGGQLIEHRIGDYVLFDDYEELQKENAELRAKLDAWEKQGPVAWMNEDNGVVISGNKKYSKSVGIEYPSFNEPLFTRPKEA